MFENKIKVLTLLFNITKLITYKNIVKCLTIKLIRKTTLL